MACPAAPLPRLSMAATTVARPVRASAAACRCTPFEPATAAVAGQLPVRQHADERLALVAVGQRLAQPPSGVGLPPAPGVSRAVQVARMPRGIGARTGVNETRTGRRRTRAAWRPDLLQRLLDLRGVPVRAARLVGRDRAHHLAAQQLLPAARARRPRCRRRRRSRCRPARPGPRPPAARAPGCRRSRSSQGRPPGPRARICSRACGSSGRPHGQRPW